MKILRNKTLLTFVGVCFAAMSATAMDLPSEAIEAQPFDKELASQVPEAIRTSGRIRNAVTGSFSPYSITLADRSIVGAATDLSTAIGQMLGLKIEYFKNPSFSGTLMGIKAGRYDANLEPAGDYPDREKLYDFVDFAREYVIFAVKAGNPKKVNDLADTCGLKVSVMAGGSAERVIKTQSEKCVKEGKAPVEVLAFDGQAAPAMALSSGRADAFFSSQAPLSYFVKQSNGRLELAAVGKSNGFGTIYQGATVNKDDPMGPVLLKCYQKLFANGTYEKIMRKWGLENNLLKEPGINLGGKAKK